MLSCFFTFQFVIRPFAVNSTDYEAYIACGRTQKQLACTNSKGNSPWPCMGTRLWLIGRKNSRWSQLDPKTFSLCTAWITPVNYGVIQAVHRLQDFWPGYRSQNCHMVFLKTSLFLIRSQGSMDAIIYVQATPAQLQCVLVQFSRINLERKKIKSKIKNFKLNNMFSRR